MTRERHTQRSAGRTRREVLKAGAAGVAGTAALSAGFPSIVRAADTVKIGYVSPKTGPLAAFAEADEFNVASVLQAIGGKVESGGKSLDVEVIVKDSQSNPNRAAEVASELILSDEVHLLCAANTPETTNPVADQAEINEVPCVTTLCPWQPYFFGRGGDPATGFQWTYHYFWGLEDVIAVFLNLWNKLDTNKVVGGLFPNDGDGNAWGDPEIGFPKPLAGAGYTLIDPGRYQNLSDDFSAQISEFKENDVQIITGVVLPPDFTTFWTQAAQQGFRPKAASVGKALLFPVSVEALGDAGHNLSSEIWWSPSHPFTSSLTGQSCGELAAAFTAATGKQWSQPVGYGHSLLEVALDVVSRAADINDTEAVLASIVATDIATVAGPVSWGSGPVKNVAKMPLVGGQWRRTPDGPFAYDLAITSNETAPEIPRQRRDGSHRVGACGRRYRRRTARERRHDGVDRAGRRLQALRLGQGDRPVQHGAGRGRGARRRRPQRRRQEHDVQHHFRRGAAERGAGALRRPRYHADAGPRALPDGDRALLPDPPSLRQHDRVREPAGGRGLRRRSFRSRLLWGMPRDPRPHRPPGEGE